ncbi:FAD-dependent oxidoreductase [Streptomyces sp. NPDC004549]|uniref:FAD-dependent oxidoreductase n=1 Tax=Streptomyces sp. NPDC004549 TaxID=3154283 RepID=UPI0033A63C03
MRDVNQSMETSVDVTVVGAGPVGLVLAAELALAGVTVQVLERREQPDQALKAQSINVPTAEALDRRGLLPAARRIQREVLARMGSYAGVARERRPEARFTGHFAGIVLDPDLVDWSDPDLAAHTAADARMVPQRELEALLTEHVTRLGVPVRRGVEVTGLEDTGDGVFVGTNTGVLHTGWLVGCDGGHSTVRRLAGIEFPGTDPELTGYQAVVDIADPEKLAGGWTWSSRGAYRYGPQPGRVAAVEFDAPPADRSTPVTLEDVQSSLRRISGTDVTLTALRATPTRWTEVGLLPDSSTPTTPSAVPSAPGYWTGRGRRSASSAATPGPPRSARSSPTSSAPATARPTPSSRSPASPNALPSPATTP